MQGFTGSQGVSTKINNGTSEVNIGTSGGNANITIGAVSNVAVFSTTGLTVTGNVSAGNVIATTISNSASFTGGLVSITGNVSAGNAVINKALWINSDNTAGAVIINMGSNAVGTIGNSTGYFGGVYAQATTALYADLAEVYEGDAEYSPGTVVSFGGNKEVTLTQVSSDPRVAGVISEKPSYLMNNGLTAEFRSIVALTGRVPTSVIGTVSKGDMMVSAGNGYAQASATPAMGTVIGKALENFDGSSGVIEIVVGRM